MCGRYGVDLPAMEIASISGTHNSLPNVLPNYNAAPTKTLPVVHKEEGQRGNVLSAQVGGVGPY